MRPRISERGNVNFRQIRTIVRNDLWTDGRTDGRTDGQTDLPLQIQTVVRNDRWADGRTHPFVKMRGRI